MTGTRTPAWLTADVVLLAVDADGVQQVLVIRRKKEPYRNRRALPGGHIEPDETPKAAAVRELAEETGLVVAPADLHLVDVYADPGRDPRGRYASCLYVACLDTMPEPVAGDDAADAMWMPVGEALLPGVLGFDHDEMVAAAVVLTAQHLPTR